MEEFVRHRNHLARNRQGLGYFEQIGANVVEVLVCSIVSVFFFFWEIFAA